MKLLKGLSKLVTLVSIIAFPYAGFAQEFNATVQVNTSQIAQPDLAVFKTLQTSLQEFINNTKWTDRETKNIERINCSFVFVVTRYDNQRFSGNLQIAATRPVFNASYTTPIFNYKDDKIAFEYVEYAPLFYNNNQFENNLISLFSFYVYTILGIDADTYALRGGQEHFEEAQRIVNFAQASQIEGWRPADGLISRFRLTDDILSDTYKEYREVMYSYHRNAMDTFEASPRDSKEAIISQITVLEQLQNRRPNSLLLRSFFDAKGEEIASIFSSGPTVNIGELKNTLQRLAPNRSSTWRKIRT